MKKYLPVINLVLFITLTCFGFYLWHRLNLTLLSIEKHNSNLVESQVGMDWVIGLIDSNFSTVITFVTVLFSFFVVLTFLGVKETFNFSISSLNSRMDKQVSDWNVHKNYVKEPNVQRYYINNLGKSALFDKYFLSSLWYRDTKYLISLGVSLLVGLIAIPIALLPDKEIEPLENRIQRLERKSDSLQMQLEVFQILQNDSTPLEN